MLALRGTVEGFYGPPWTHEQRLDHLRFSAQVGLNSYVYAPKNDPFHRDRWREPYPAAELAQLGELARAAAAAGIRFGYAISPALSMRFGDDAEHAALTAKCEQLWDAGIRSFALFFDDVPPELPSSEDVARYGAGPAGSGAAHGECARRFAEGFLAGHGVDEPLLVCPTDYAGIDPSPYRDALAEAAPPDALIAWTGRDIVVGEITRADIDAASASYRRRLVLWDNFPVNDFDPARVFLGPLTGRPADLAGAPMEGVLANPMVQAVPSRIALATVADWARDPSAYDPAASARAALLRVADASASALAPLVRACSAWPPSADQDPELTRATTDALAGDAAALDVVAARLQELADGCWAAVEPAELVEPLRPWLDAAITTAMAGLAAVRLLRGEVAARDEAERALSEVEAQPAHVLQPIVAPFVRAAIRR
ncbi:MAG TPA: protein O-GlcNAcase [Jatrophihabitantaceae bacterium]